MIKHILFPATILILMGFLNPSFSQKAKQGTESGSKNDVKFLEDITVDIPASTTTVSDPKAVFSKPIFTSQKAMPVAASNVSTASIENAEALQFKYALLLDMEVEMIQNLGLFKIIDEWLGARYKLGGTSRDGIDCSALMQVLFTSFYGLSIPRTAREQYDFTRRISRIELREGDLVFFNTIGGVSHVGMYLQNNKFIHASSGGVTISDLYEDYWMKRFVGVGRVDAPPANALTSSHP
jgi:cell wall-associated NlpC family hydrolase